MSRFNLPTISRIEHYARLEANYLASYFVTNQMNIIQEYEKKHTLAEKVQLLIDLIVNRQEYIFDELENNKSESTNCEFYIPCFIF